MLYLIGQRRIGVVNLCMMRALDTHTHTPTALCHPYIKSPSASHFCLHFSYVLWVESSCLNLLLNLSLLGHVSLLLRPNQPEYSSPSSVLLLCIPLKLCVSLRHSVRSMGLLLGSMLTARRPCCCIWTWLVVANIASLGLCCVLFSLSFSVPRLRFCASWSISTDRKPLLTPVELQWQHLITLVKGEGRAKEGKKAWELLD